MTKEQQIQHALKQALKDALEALEYDVAVHATKLDDSPTAETEDEVYPCVVINTSTPIPAGHKSRIIEAPAWITIMSYLPDDLKSARFAEIAEIVFATLHGIDDWSEFEATGKTIEINACVISSSEEPSIDGFKVIQTTVCAVHANILP